MIGGGQYDWAFWVFVTLCVLVLVWVALLVEIFTDPSFEGFLIIIAYALYEVPFIGLFYLFLLYLQT